VEHRRGFPKLVEVVRKLRAEGLLVDLVINGGDPENIIEKRPPWLQLHERQPLRSFADVLRNVDVGVITYVDREYWSLMSITKMASYMAAGLPIICLRLTETSNILEKWACGLSAEDWGGFEAAIKELYKDKSLRKKLAKNAREAAVQEYNWLKQSQRFGDFIEKLLTGRHEGSSALSRHVTFGKDREAQGLTVSNETHYTL
jgi:glycosyltransferase involved in cell wall biosynthesis